MAEIQLDFYDESDFGMSNMDNRALKQKASLCMKRHNRLLDLLIQYKAEVNILRRKVDYYQKRVQMLKRGDDFRTFEYVDKTLKRQRNERQSKQSSEK